MAVHTYVIYVWYTMIEKFRLLVRKMMSFMESSKKKKHTGGGVKTRVDKKAVRRAVLQARRRTSLMGESYQVEIGSHYRGQDFDEHDLDLSFATEEYIDKLNLSPLAKANVLRVVNNYNFSKRKKK